MKTTLFISILTVIFSISTQAQDSIPNNNFESWASPTVPDYWETTNILLPPSLPTCTKTTNAYSGNFAIKLKTIKIDDLLVPGVATLGSVEFNSVSGGIPYTDRPKFLSGFVMHPGQGDSVLIAIEFIKNGQIIGSGLWGTKDSIPNYTSFSAPIDFSSNENPDTMNIVMLTDPLKHLSTLIVDELHLEILTNTDFTNEIPKLHIYPNPAKTELTIEPPISKTYSYSVYNILGLQIQEGDNIQGRKKVDVKNLDAGTYIIVCRDEDKLLGKKVFIKSK